MKNPFKKPVDNSLIQFKDANGEVFKGVYIEDEDICMIGFDETGEFRFFFEIISWNYLEQNTQK